MKSTLTIAAFLVTTSMVAQVITQPFTPEQYVNDVLLEGGVTASNIVFTGGADQIGLVSNSSPVLGLGGGVMLNTDHVSCSATCTNCGGLNNDPDLISVANSVPPLIGQSFSVGSTYDVARLEFDFVAQGDSISFDYVFGSDEYLTWINTPYNDIFAFFLSGPGIVGPYSSPGGFPGGAINLAQVPNSNPPLPITISSVNNQINSQYFIQDTTWSCSNGFTTPLRAEAVVQEGEMYHIELVIADCSDSALESFVVIGNFNSPIYTGCTNEEACNYDPLAEFDDGSCLILGCTNPNADNYDASANENDGSCTFGEGLCTGLSYEVIASDPLGTGANTYRIYATFSSPNVEVTAIYGMDTEVWNLIGDAPFYQDSSGSDFGGQINPLVFPNFPSVEYDTWWTIGAQPGDADGLNVAFDDALASFDDWNNGGNFVVNTFYGGTIFVWPGANEQGVPVDGRVLLGQVTTAGTTEALINLQFRDDNQASYFASGLSLTFPTDSTVYDSCTELETEGCTNEFACNYNPVANVDDGSCEFVSCLGCTDSSACNYDANASIDNGECIYPGCLDPLACNFDSTAGCDGVLCEYPPASACNCLGDELDALGVCGGDCMADVNGNGICDVDELDGSAFCGWGTYWNEDSMACVLLVPPYLGDYGDFSALNPCYFNLDNSSSVGANDLLNFLGVYGQEADCLGYDDAGSTPWSCGDPIGYQGYDYATVLIGDQCWFAENLRNQHYDNGDAILDSLSASEWSSTLSGATAVFGEGDSGCSGVSPFDVCDEDWSLNEYGRLYNWYAVDDPRGLCPSGWHVPTDGEWMTMEIGLGMTEEEANGTSLRGTDQGLKMKAEDGWIVSINSFGDFTTGNGTNSSGFSALSGGARNSNYSSNTGSFYSAGSVGRWWTSSPAGNRAWDRVLCSCTEGVYRYDQDRRFGFSVRCIQDAE